MSTTLRRYELLLPLRFNEGQPVPDSLIADTLVELEQQFGAVSSETQIIRGQWQYQGQSYRDELVRIFVDVPDTPKVASSSSPTKTNSRAASARSMSG